MEKEQINHAGDHRKLTSSVFKFEEEDTINVVSLQQRTCEA